MKTCFCQTQTFSQLYYAWFLQILLNSSLWNCFHCRPERDCILRSVQLLVRFRMDQNKYLHQSCDCDQLQFWLKNIRQYKKISNSSLNSGWCRCPKSWWIRCRSSYKGKTHVCIASNVQSNTLFESGQYGVLNLRDKPQMNRHRCKSQLQFSSWLS